MNYSSEVLAQVRRIGEYLISRGWTITAAESCTGGLFCGALTAVAGSSAWFNQGLVTYSNNAKTRWVSVPEATLQSHGAVSRATVESMATGAMAATGADVAVTISGIAGPDGAVADKPVGTVWIAVASADGGVGATLHQFDGDRQSVRIQAVEAALRATLLRVENTVGPG